MRIVAGQSVSLSVSHMISAIALAAVSALLIVVMSRLRPASSQQRLVAGVPGLAGRDYPVLARVPPTLFSCRGQVAGGYYADPQTQCQAFHVCLDQGRPELTKLSFLCPNGESGSVWLSLAWRGCSVVFRDFVPAGVLHLRLVVQCGLQDGSQALEPQHQPGG